MRPTVALPYWEERWVAPYAAGARNAGADVTAFSVRGARPPAAVIAECQGVLLIGGGDVDPQLYGTDDPRALCQHVEPERDAYEIELLALALARDLPALCICRGHQVLAVARGGALHLDIPSELPAALAHSCGREVLDAHEVRLVAGSRLAGLLGTGPLAVNSRHHQAVRADRIGAGLVVTGRAPDDVIEGLESTAHRFVVGVQWHPEDFVDRGGQFAPLFAALVAEMGTREGLGTVTRFPYPPGFPCPPAMKPAGPSPSGSHANNAAGVTGADRRRPR